MHSVLELRKSKRYRLDAPALFMWAHQDESPQTGRGVTRDMNTFGVYVLTDTAPPVGALVQMEIVLPKLMDSGFGMRLQGEGVVIRVESRGTKAGAFALSGFAASVQFHTETSVCVLSHLETSEQVV